MSALLSLAPAQPKPAARLPVRLVLLTNYIPPHTLPYYVALAKRVEEFVILISTPMEPHRQWEPDYGGLDVRVQRTWSMQRRWRHPIGIAEKEQIHIPYDTISQLRKLKPDAVIAAQFGMRSMMCGLYRKFFRRVPLVLSVNLSEHTEQGRGWHRGLLRKWLVKQADAIAVNGESGRRYLARIGCDPKQIHTVPYTHVQGVFEDLPSHRENGRAHRLLFSGQLVERKGLAPFIAALQNVARRRPEEQIEMRIVGGGPLMESLRAMEHPANLQIEFTGPQTFQQLGQHYADAGILVLPTLADEWGMVVNEAMAAGLPVLGSVYSQAVEELVDEGTTGWAFRTDHSNEIEEAIEAALNTPVSQLNHMRHLARARVADITPEYAAAQMVGAVSAAIDSSKTKRRRRENG